MKFSAGVLTQATTFYDAAGAELFSHSVGYGYTPAYRLIQANHPTLDNETYSYDKVGNRLSELLGDINTGNNTNTDSGTTTPVTS
ncbi:hypothetical protein [Ostreibacterium oceani]|uniref:Uncharacterized protein n=1 Tax=Ostreibacterium oceani TaxID=2654998 RepID=A0A6N7F1T9_9GAMM|nr:hypothetical protein [Ostreibacterium oceani]MPV85826.1 hypothetical protein [Ostreibacterium oceani]